MDRRNFINDSVKISSAFLGYSVMVKAGTLGAEISREDRGKLIDVVAPDGDKVQIAAAEPNMKLVELECDVLVCGGGMSGVCAAISAARNGAKVILIQDRSRLGGNASSEVRMHIVGADASGGHLGWREGGLIEEFRIEDAVNNPHRAWELWDLMLYDKCVSEPNLTLLLDSIIYSAEVKDGLIQHAMVRCDKTEHLYKIKAKIFCDCTGDARLALEAGAEFRSGRESKKETGEKLALDVGDKLTQGSSILFTSRYHEKPMPYHAPSWTRKITKSDLRFRGVGSWEYGYWWIELGGMYDTIRDNERLRFELLSVVLGVWDYIKNSGNHPDSENWALETVGMIPGKRESRRILGDHIMTQMDMEGGWRKFKDGICIGGWGFDEHPPEGFDAPEKRPFRSIKMKEPYNIAFGSLYSRNVQNMMMAGRNISCTHVAFTSARVMATCAVEGQATGTAAAYACKQNILPREIRDTPTHMTAVQQYLLRDDQSIREIKNNDKEDVARLAKVTASSSYKNGDPSVVLSGDTRDMSGEWKNRWIADNWDKLEPWIELNWETPQRLSKIQLVFDTGFNRVLTLTSSKWYNDRITRSAQPETVSNYNFEAVLADGTKKKILEIKDNYLRLRRHEFETVEVKSLRMNVTAMNGLEKARLYEIRCYS